MLFQPIDSRFGNYGIYDLLDNELEAYISMLQETTNFSNESGKTIVMPVSKKRKCPICDSPKSKLLFRQHFYMISGCALLDGYDVVVCEKCGFCYADKIPQQSDFDFYYREMSKYEYQDHGNRISRYDMARFQSTASYLGGFLPSPETCILEIGCSTGTLLSLLKKKGFDNVIGLDPSPTCSEVAQRLYGIRVQTNTLFEIAVKVASIDVLIMVGVLEHVRELKMALKICWNLLSDDGLFYIEVPDASCYDKGEDAPFQEFSPEHINFFDPDSLKNLMITNGFTQVAMEQITVETNYRTTTPAIRSVYKKNKPATSFTLTHDFQTKAELMAYIDHSCQMDSQIQTAIARVVNTGQSIIVWGTGAHTLRLLATGALSRAKIRAFVDSNSKYQGKQLNGVPIVPPQAIKEWPEPILISSRVYQEEIAGQIINELQLRNEIIRLYSYDR